MIFQVIFSVLLTPTNYCFPDQVKHPLPEVLLKKNLPLVVIFQNFGNFANFHVFNVFSTDSIGPTRSHQLLISFAGATVSIT